jgi:hypothetical protein
MYRNCSYCSHNNVRPTVIRPAARAGAVIRVPRPGRGLLRGPGRPGIREDRGPVVSTSRKPRRLACARLALRQHSVSRPASRSTGAGHRPGHASGQARLGPRPQAPAGRVRRPPAPAGEFGAAPRPPPHHSDLPWMQPAGPLAAVGAGWPGRSRLLSARHVEGSSRRGRMRANGTLEGRRNTNVPHRLAHSLQIFPRMQ